jgi:hypothetical protein
MDNNLYELHDEVKEETPKVPKRRMAKVVNCTGLNLRVLPEGIVTKVLAPGTMLQIHAASDRKGWYYVEGYNIKGYVRKEYLEEIKKEK